MACHSPDNLGFLRNCALPRCGCPHLRTGNCPIRPPSHIDLNGNSVVVDGQGPFYFGPFGFPLLVGDFNKTPWSVDRSPYVGVRAGLADVLHDCHQCGNLSLGAGGAQLVELPHLGRALPLRGWRWRVRRTSLTPLEFLSQPTSQWPP